MNFNEKININPIKINDLNNINTMFQKSDFETFDIVKFCCSEFLYMIFINNDITKFYSKFNDKNCTHQYTKGVMFYVSDINKYKYSRSGGHQMYLCDYNENLQYIKPAYSNWNIVNVYKKPVGIELMKNNEKIEIDTFDVSQNALKDIIIKYKYRKITIDNTEYIRL